MVSAAFAIAFVLSALFTKVTIELLHMRGWLFRRPTEDRWHHEPTPVGGGIAMFVTFSAVAAAFGLLRADLLNILLAGG
ncbi:MAG TPA: hypothetical protein VI895_03830, partial [Bdellovibrionota bacterium]|nr:hypothetical protein [Bdellovibrionota bacterium]